MGEVKEWQRVIARPVGGERYEYRAVNDDLGQVAVIRKRAMRLYSFAFQYDVPVTGGNKTGESVFWTFGVKPNHWYQSHVHKTFKVEVLETED